MSENSRQRYPPAPQYTEAITLSAETGADHPTITIFSGLKLQARRGYDRRGQPAANTALNREVAIKVLPDALCAGRCLLQRWKGDRPTNDRYRIAGKCLPTRTMGLLTATDMLGYRFRLAGLGIRCSLINSFMEPEETYAAPAESKALDLLAAGNVSAAVAAITAVMDIPVALQALAQLCQRAYRDLKSVPTMTALAWEAVGFGLKCAAASPESESASRYKTSARAIAYNAGANCWPGWGDAVEIKPADIAEGLKLAERSYELVVELDLGDKAIGTALWLIGALQMAGGRLSTAIRQFLRAEEAFQAAQLPAHAAMAQGYAALAEKGMPESHLRGAESMETILHSLRGMDSREAQFFADQLLTADRIFSSR
jgi:hypothetical protein